MQGFSTPRPLPSPCTARAQESEGVSAWDVCMRMKALGLLAKPTQRNVIRFAPPLTMTEPQLRECVDIIARALLGSA